APKAAEIDKSGRWPAEVVCGWVIPALLASLYLAIIAMTWSGHQGGFSSLHEVAQLFENPWLLLAGWVHYLAFDLLVGGWIVRDARARGIRHLFVLPSLMLTFLFGPAGWLSYLALRAGLRRHVSTSGDVRIVGR
ncbi:MAG: ABA4-like family protein, partial [Deltaproteobacteria bacterium]